MATKKIRWCVIGAGGNIYQKQFAAFNKLLLAGTTCYDNPRTALNIQQLCDGIYGR